MKITAKSLRIIIIALAIFAGIFFVSPELVLAEEVSESAPVMDIQVIPESVEETQPEVDPPMAEAEEGASLSVEETENILESLAGESVVVEVDELSTETTIEEIEQVIDETKQAEDPVTEEVLITLPLEDGVNESIANIETTSIAEAKSSGGSEITSLEVVSIEAEVVISEESGTLSLGSSSSDNNSEVSISAENSSATGNSSGGNTPERVVSIEFTFGTNSSSELAISSELAVNTESQGGGDPDPVSEIAISPESTFTSQSGTGSDNELAISAELSFATTEGATDSEIAISPELSVATDDGDEPETEAEIVVSSEGTFTTSNESDNSEFAISPEVSVTTETDGGDPDPVSEIAISPENSFATVNETNDPEIAISLEMSFTTDDDSVDPQVEIAISDENSFTTDDDDVDPQSEIAISPENSFTTDDDGSDPEIAISAELTFTTSDNDDDDGGGGGGGGGGRRHKTPPAPMQCVPYLREFIRFGYPNNPIEVLKLKLFLNNYEGFNLALTPIYDLEAFRAVEIFQTRYRSDVLNPWSTLEPTGFVYITTSLKINYIVCGITDSIDMKLIPRGRLLELVPAAVEVLPVEEILVPAIDGEVGSEDPELNDFLSLIRLFNPNDLVNRLFAGLSFLSFDGLWNWLVGVWDWCLIIILILLLIILYLLRRNRRLKEEMKNLSLKREVESVSEKIRESLREIKGQDLPGIASLDSNVDEVVVADEAEAVLADEAGDEYVSHDDLFGESQKDIEPQPEADPSMSDGGGFDDPVDSGEGLDKK